MNKLVRKGDNVSKLAELLGIDVPQKKSYLTLQKSHETTQLPFQSYDKPIQKQSLSYDESPFQLSIKVSGRTLILPSLQPKKEEDEELMGFVGLILKP